MIMKTYYEATNIIEKLVDSCAYHQELSQNGWISAPKCGGLLKVSTIEPDIWRDKPSFLCSICESYDHTNDICPTLEQVNAFERNTQMQGVWNQRGGYGNQGWNKEGNNNYQPPDGSIRQPIRKLEDVIVRVENYCFPVDFIVADMKVIENLSHAPIILGRPFSATSQVSTDFGKGIVKIKVGKKR
ncbi:unnamed protein product [Spirodela intermedia]|uniref:Uncharacterized protein n=1 Tax=Spirodela intermedia TaxID=51605 RepID=A0A7I8K9H5_SPIIN|nr:unnamed protein product [Spirodela intermedia]